MAKIKFTKGELKRQRDILRQYLRYLPTLQLKKQQLQIEILHEHALYAEKYAIWQKKFQAVGEWSGLFSDKDVFLQKLVKLSDVHTATRNIAGVDIPVFNKADFQDFDYDLFSTPLWVDHAIEQIKVLISLEQEIAVIQKGITLLEQELRITTQRVNLFEKVKIPEAEEAIRLIRIFIGDQMANAVGRSKIAKKKLSEHVGAGV